jgi:hypothetical protein
MSGGGLSGEGEMRLRGTITMHAAGKESIRVAFKVDSLDAFSATGVLKKQLGDPTLAEVQAMLSAHGEGEYVMDVHGKDDEAATQALPSVRAHKKALSARHADQEKQQAEARKAGREPEPTGPTPEEMLEMVTAAFLLADLPRKPLVPGEALTVEEEDEVERQGFKMPIETETVYRLVGLSGSMAEVQVEAESSGATELGKGHFVTMDASSEATMTFDVGKGVPVELRGHRTQVMTFGEKGFESTSDIETTYSASHEAPE